MIYSESIWENQTHNRIVGLHIAVLTFICKKQLEEYHTN